MENRKPADNRSSYYTAVNDFDKHIARRYDTMRNSWFIDTLVALLSTKVINEVDLTGVFRRKVKELMDLADNSNK